MDEEKQTTEMQSKGKAQPVDDQKKSVAVDSEQLGEEKTIDFKSWKTWLIIALILIVVGGGIYYFFF